MPLNIQDPGIEWTAIFGPRTGRTWNPVGGCFHHCEWLMPDGVIAECYAGAQVARQRSEKFYPHGFEHHYFFPERLEEPTRTPAGQRLGIFLDSMSDLMGHWVDEEQIRAVLDVVWRTPQHVYFLLTKNAPRLLKFRDEFPKNLFVGVSMPPDHFMNRPLDDSQKNAFLRNTLSVLHQLGDRGLTRFISFEPLSWDVTASHAFTAFDRLPLEWAIIGAASNGRTYYQPEPAHYGNLAARLDAENIPTFHKGNLASDPHRVEFPAVPPPISHNWLCSRLHPAQT